MNRTHNPPVQINQEGKKPDLSNLSPVNKLQEFKDYVHKRLDDAGIPVDPESTHKEHGCRIGGRLDFVFDKILKLEQENERLNQLLNISAQ